MATKKTAPETPVEEAPKPTEKVVFSKAKILKLNRYANRRDYLSAKLEDGKNYTLDQVDSLIEKFNMKGRVK